jgi:hypothetical protein
MVRQSSFVAAELIRSLLHTPLCPDKTSHRIRQARDKVLCLTLLMVNQMEERYGEAERRTLG